MNLFYDIKTEEAVLGALILEKDAYLIVSEIIESDDFYREKHAKIYEAIQDLFVENKAIDIITIHTKLKESGEKISAFDLSKLTENVASAAHIEYHARILKDLSIRRKLLIEIERLKKIGLDSTTDLDILIDKTSVLIDNVLSEIDNKSNIRNYAENLKDAVEVIQERQNSDINKYGIKPHLKAVRTFIPLWENGDLIIVAARPGMGKTAFVLNETAHIASTQGAVLFFSLEMHRRQLVNRNIQRETGLSRYDLDNPTIEQWRLIEEAISYMKNWQLFIDDTPNVSISHLKAKIKIFKKKHDIKAVVIDYMQLMQADKTIPREQQVAQITRSCKLIAKEFQIPIFLVTQLNRGPENRKESAYRPRMSDLRESGASEQDADIIIFPHRPAYYFPDDDEFKNIAEILIAKNRNGQTGMARVHVNDTITKFYDIIHQYDEDAPY